MPRKSVTALILPLVVGAALVATLWQSLPQSAHAQRRQNQNNNNQPDQPPPRPVRTGDLKKIDTKAVKVEEEFIRNAYDIAQEYEKAGDLERSIEYLEAMLKIRPELPGAKEKIEELQDGILSANDFKFDLNVDGNWGQPVGFVRKGKPFRISASGQYRVQLSTTLGPDGIPAGDLQREMLEGIETGKLAGVIVTNNKPGEPFPIGSELNVTPENSGYLLLKVNVPPGSKCSGKLEVELSGYVLSPNLDNIGK